MVGQIKNRDSKTAKVLSNVATYGIWFSPNTNYDKKLILAWTSLDRICIERSSYDHEGKLFMKFQCLIYELLTQANEGEDKKICPTLRDIDCCIGPIPLHCLHGAKL